MLYAILVGEASELETFLLATELTVIFALALVVAVLVVDFVESNSSSLTVDEDFVSLSFAFVEVMLFVDLVVSVSVGVTVKSIRGRVEDVVVCSEDLIRNGEYAVPAEDDVTVLDSIEVFAKSGLPVSLGFASCVDKTFSVDLIIGSIDAVAVSSSISSVVTFDEG